MELINGEPMSTLKLRELNLKKSKKKKSTKSFHLSYKEMKGIA